MSYDLDGGGLYSDDTGGYTRLERAAARAAETNDLTPLLKEELRLQILTKRHATGKTAIDIDLKAEPKTYRVSVQTASDPENPLGGGGDGQ